uniref:Ferritin n=1 Tax=Dermanyssus gallinae TaxID=34641 RepID=A0A8E5KGN5_9ACAR|nr:ferritin 2 [Dermanyssus gallinae]
MSTASRPRQNFHADCEDAINKQINMELYASYVYMSMGFYFDRDDVAFKNVKKFFLKASEEEREHAMKLMSYQNMRGGRIVLQPVAKPERDEWDSIQQAFESAIELEKKVNESLLNIHKIASDHADAQFCDFLETHYLEEQVKSIKQLSDHITNIIRVGSGLGEFIFNKELGDD